MAQFTIQLSNNNPTYQLTSLGFQPNKLLIYNNTSNPVYVRTGGADIPKISNADQVVPPATATNPAQSIVLPTVAHEFAFQLVTSPPLTDTTQVCTVIVQGDGVLPRNFF